MAGPTPALSDPYAPGFLHRLPDPPRKVVILRTSRIGDFIVATPALRALRTALPRTHFTFIGLPFLRDLVERSPHLDRFVEFPGYPGLAEQFFDARAATRFFAGMQAEKFDLAVQLNGSGVYANPFALMLGARHTVGWVRPGESAGRLSAALPWPAEGHEITRALSLPLFLGAPHCGEEREFPLLPQDHAETGRLLGPVPTGSRLIGLHPGTREATKRWPPSYYAALAASLWDAQTSRNGSPVFLLLGGPDEAPLAAAVHAALQTLRPAAAAATLDLTGRTTLGGLGAVIERLSVLVTNDSGPAHIAYARHTPTVTLFGATDPARWGPPRAAHFRTLWNALPCWPCDLWTCPHAGPAHNACLTGLPVAEVARATLEIMR